MKDRSLRSSAISVAFIARQFGVRVNSDALEEQIKNRSLSSTKDFEDYFFRQGVLIKLRKLKISDLLEKKYIFPCAGILNNGRSYILIGIDAREGKELAKVVVIDPMDPTAKPERIDLDTFTETWSGQIVLVSRSSGEGAKDRTFDWRWFLPELYRFKGIMAIAFVVAIIGHAVGIAPIIYIQISLDKVLGYEAMSTLYVLTAGVVLLLLFNGILAYGRDYVIEHISTAIESRLMGDLFDKLLELPAQTFQLTTPSEMEGKVLSIIAVRSFFSRQILTNLYDATGILVFVPILFGYSPILAGVVVAFSILQGLIDLAAKKRTKEIGISVGKANKRRLSALRETIGGIDAVKSFSQEPLQRRDWRSAAAESIRSTDSMGNVTNLSSSINATLMNLMTIAVVFTGILLVFAGNLSAGAIISCNMLGAKVVAPTKKIITFFADTHIITGAMEQISSIWNANPERVGVGTQHVIKGNYEFRNVTVRFGENEALKSINLSIPGRKRIAVVGASGSGKTTLLRLLQGLIKPNDGIMEVDGSNIASHDLNHYRSQVAMVDLAPAFFTGTIEENIRRVRPNMSDREMEVVLDVSGLGALVKTFPDGLNTKIDQSASNLSPAYKIIIALARALATHSPLLLLDKTLTSVDKGAQVHLKNNLGNIGSGRTVVCTVYDMRFIHNFDWIIVLDDGHVAGQGEHSKLLLECAPYKALWDMEKQISTIVSAEQA